MENKPLFIAYLATWLMYVAAIHGYAMWSRISHARVGLSHAAPSLVAISMACIFLIGGGATVRQHVAYSGLGMSLWSLWVALWPLLLLATFGAGVAQAVWTIVASVTRGRRARVPVAALGTGMCVFSFVVVMENFPDV